MKLVSLTLLVVVAVGFASAQSVPLCRQTFVDANNVTHLVDRGEGKMGCISDQECIENTSPDSWCKADGTCRGCNDWEGCCDLGLTPAEPPVFCNYADPRQPGGVNRGANYFCALSTGCGNSYCREDNTCFPCDPTDDAHDGYAGYGYGPFFQSVGQLEEVLAEACRSTWQCPKANIDFYPEDVGSRVIDGETFYYTSNSTYLSWTYCVDPCDGERPGYDPLVPPPSAAECKLGGDGEDERCRSLTGCSGSYCKESGESASGYGICHYCEDDSSDPSPPACSGISEDQHEVCRVATGCSHSYCKGAVCQECADDGYTGAAP